MEIILNNNNLNEILNLDCVKSVSKDKITGDIVFSIETPAQQSNRFSDDEFSRIEAHTGDRLVFRNNVWNVVPKFPELRKNSLIMRDGRKATQYAVLRETVKVIPEHPCSFASYFCLTLNKKTFKWALIGSTALLATSDWNIVSTDINSGFISNLNRRLQKFGLF